MRKTLITLLGIVLCVLVSGMIDLGEAINIHGVGIDGQNLLRDILLLCLAGLSWKFTTRQCRELNGFSWAPIEEVAKLFLGIFLSMIPALAILRAGTDGALAGVINMVFHDGEPVGPQMHAEKSTAPPLPAPQAGTKKGPPAGSGRSPCVRMIFSGGNPCELFSV